MTVRPAKTPISLGIRPVWSESSLCAQWVAKGHIFLHADSEDWSDWADAQADLSLRWAHMPFCWFCPEAAQMLLWCRLLYCMTSLKETQFCAGCIEYCHVSFLIYPLSVTTLFKQFLVENTTIRTCETLSSNYIPRLVSDFYFILCVQEQCCNDSTEMFPMSFSFFLSFFFHSNFIMKLTILSKQDFLLLQ